MIQSVGMNETAGMLETRLRLVERIRRVAHALAREEQAKVATALLKGRSHDLGNAIQIVKLSALELERRAKDRADLVELTADMRQAAEQATAVLADMLAAARPAERKVAGAPVAPTLRAAVELAREAYAGIIELRDELDDTVRTLSTGEELEGMMFAALVDAMMPAEAPPAAGATRITVVLRERTIERKRWLEVLRIDDRKPVGDVELAHAFEPASLLHVVASAAKQAGGEVSLAPGRGGLELAIALPVAQSSSSS